MNTPFRSLLAALIMLCSLLVQAQDYRTVASGNWTSPGIWEVNDGSGWMNASEFPIAGNSTLIDVRSPHTVTVSGTTGGSFSIDDLIIRFGATLTMADGCHSFTDGPAEKDVQIFGTYNAGSPCGSAGGDWQVVVSVESGGIVNFNAAGSIFTTVIVQENGTVNGNTAINAAGPVVNNGTWTMAGSNAISIPTGVSFTNNGILSWKSGTVSGTLTNNGTLTWTGGTVTSSPLGTINNTSGATFTASGGTAQNGAISNQGTFNWTGGSMLSFTAIGTFLNSAGAVFNMTGVTGNNTFYQAITNQGTINFSGTGTLTPNAGTSITNTGSININTGQWDWNYSTTHTGVINIASGATLNLTTGTCTLNAGSALSGTGIFRLGGATLAQNITWTNSSLAIVMAGGTWSTSSGNVFTMDVGGTFNWSGGALGGPGTYAVDLGATLNMITGGKTLNSTLTNNGTIAWSGGQLVGTGNIQNASGGTLNITFSGITNPLAVTVVNNGTINYTHSGNFNTWFPFTNNGTLNVNSGQWHFNNSAVSSDGVLNIATGAVVQVNVATTLGASASITGGGILRISNTLTQNFPWTVSIYAVELIGGTWNGSGAITFPATGIFNWTAGTLSGTGGYSVDTGASISIYTTNTKTVGGTLTNNGTINWSGGQINQTGSGSINNASGGTINITFSGVSNPLAVNMVNNGMLNYTGTGNFNTFFNFTNNGTLNVNSGQWHFNNTAVSCNGALSIATGAVVQVNVATTLGNSASITGGGILRIANTLTQNFPWTVSILAVELIGGTWNGSGAITFPASGIFNWTAGTLSGTGGYIVDPSASISLYTGNTKTLASTLTNNGTIAWSGGQITQSGTGHLLNASGGTLNISFSGIGNPVAVNLTNNGTINYTGTGAFNTISPFIFTNNGALNISSGSWTFNGTNSHTATSSIAVAATRTLTFSIAPGTFAGTVQNSGTLAGTITSFTGPTFTNNGSVTLTTLPFAGTAAQTLDGTGSITNLTLNNANGLTLGGTQTVTGTLTLTTGRITLGNNDLILSNSALAGLVGGNATNHIVTNGTGTFKRNLPIGGANFPFPIGTGASYLPVTLSNTSGPAERFGARVANDVHMEYSAPGVPQGPVVQNDQVERTWTLSEQTEGGNQASVQLQWNAADEGANFDRANSGLHAYNGTDWVALTLGAAAGSNPYTRNATGVSSFREFTVADGESTLPFSCPGGVIPGMACDDEDACTTNDVVNAECDCVGIFQDSDNDGTCNADDGCPNDANKTAPGACGCGVVDVPQIYYVDSDGDGFGAGAPVPGFTCNVPPGHVTNNTDCDDSNPAIKPGAPEVCNGIDDNCDGQVDNTNLGNGLVAYLSFNGNTNDGSTTSNNANAPSGSAYATGVNGTTNSAFQFGGGRYVVLPHNAAYDLGTGDFTYSIWLNWSSTSYGSVIDKNNYSNGVFGLNCFVDYPSSGNFMARPGEVVTGAGLGNNTWHHVVTTRTGTTLRIYVNGVLSATSAIASVNLNNPSSIFIGRHGGSAQQFYTGRMDNLRLYNRALSAAEVAELRASELAGEVGGGTGIAYYADQDGDGFGDPNTAQVSCTPIPGYVTNNTDACPNDPLKQAPGACGCGNVEVDTDGDSTPDCIDACPNDPLKIAPLACGCGNAETDTDGDSTPDCVDGCPNDPLKTAAGACGCGNADTDSDSDGIADCVDSCPGVAGTIGSPCDDGDATTSNDALNASCECVGQLLDCSGVPGGSALPGTACTTGGLPGIWNNSCVCELEGPDVAVQNVSAPNDTIAADQSITLSWEVLNLGNADATVNWTERYYMESGTGQNRVQLGQATHNSGTPLAPSAMLSRSVQLVMPALINVGDEARFVVEIIPGTGLIELPNSAANNTGIQAQTWVVRKLIKLLVPQTSINEGSLAGIPVVVQRTGSLDAAQVVNISIDQEERFDFPPTLTILAGQSARSFTLVALENAMLEGPIPTVLTASASGFSSATRNLTIIDNESPALSITGLPATTGEGTSVTFQVNTSFAPTAALQVFLTSSNQARFAVPASVTIQANTTTANVTVNLPQDQLPELDIDVTITAGAANHSPTTATFALTDDDVPGLALLLLTDTVSESAGAFAVQATLQRTAGSSPIAFTAQLSASLPNTLLLPASISLPANANQQTFTIGVVDNALVDGFRNVIINATVQIAGCGCGAPPATAGNVNATLVVADNDGPSLSVSVNPATMAEGLANAGTLRVQRNTATTEALSVTLFSSDVNELTLPATVLIPIGASFLDVPITTVNDSTPDGSEQVYVQASAGGFSPGITWCIVTDVNQPDLIVTALSASSSPWAALTTITWQATVANTGFANSIVGIPVRGVLSQNNSVDANDIVLFNYTINTPVVAGGSVQISGAALVPNTPGTQQLLIQVNPDASTSELTYTNNTSAPLTVNIAPSYSAFAQVAGTTFLRGTTIPVTGTATRPDASPAANEPIEVYVLTNGLRREVLTTTDASGNFTASFLPLANESGHYTVGASFPGMQLTAEQDAFDILGVRINNGQYPQFVTLIGDTLTGTLTIENLSNAPLTNLTLTPSNPPAGSNFSFSTIPTLAGGASATVTYEVSGTALSPGFNFQAATLNVVSDQGSIQQQPSFYYCVAPGGLINASISSINTTVSQAMGQQLVEFKVRNIGAGSTGALSLSLPQAPWLSAMTPVNMPSLAPGDSALVILRFLAHASVPFDFPVNGTVVLNGANSNSLVIPFSFMKVSVTTGTLTVDAVNQFTFFDPAEPHVAGASVEVRHAYSNALLASGTTDLNGLFTATNIPEGTHRLTVSKPQHLTYDQPVTINPGATLNRTAFLNYQAITFSWNVVPTQIQDQYDVSLTMQFETNIPIPVVTIDMPDTMPQLFGNEVYAFNVTLTNHGLIAARNVQLLLPASDPEYEFLTNYATGDIAALQSIQVPALMRRRTEPLLVPGGPSIEEVSQFLSMDEEAYRNLDGFGIQCKAYAFTVYEYDCNAQTGIVEQTGKEFNFEARICEFSIVSWQPVPPQQTDGPEGDCLCWLYPDCCGAVTTPSGPWINLPQIEWDQVQRNCKKCAQDLLGVAGCVPGLGNVAGAFSCGWSVSDALLEEGALSEVLFSCIGNFAKPLNPILCMRSAHSALGNCLGASPSLPSAMELTEMTRDGSGIYEQAYDDLDQLLLALEADSIIRSVLCGDLAEHNALDELSSLVSPYLNSQTAIPPVVQSGIITSMEDFGIEAARVQAFIDRWNTSLEAWALGITSPNEAYPDIIDRAIIGSAHSIIWNTSQYALSRGFDSILELYGAFVEFVESQEAESNAVCASVTVQLSQTVTMTREAFRGTLDIFNGHPTDALDSLTVNIVIKDTDGVPSNGFFQINTEQLTNLSDVTGTGMIPAQENGMVEFLFIPEIGAAPTVPVAYAFGGEVTYWDPFNEEMTSIVLAPVTLTVNPSPNLMLHYFMERNILGDDALTSPEVEPSIPAELAVMVENDGYGPAVNMSISSAQPEIVENESGLAINFSLVGSNLQGQPAQLGVLNIPFGTIPPQSTRIGQWWFTSSLLGKFVSYEASVVHANSFGNPELSLIQGVELHELTRSIREYGPGSDGMNDFLVNDQFDINDRPDIIYFSQGNRTEEVLPAASGSFNAPVSAPTFTNTLTLEAAEEGWNYIKLNDPGNGNFDIVSVTRQDAQPIPLANAWLTFVTLPVSQPPVYEDKFHFVDKLATTAPTTYTVVWAPKNTDVPAIDTITGAPQTVTALQVTNLAVVFDKAIDPATFTVDDLTLTFQGGPNLMNSSAIITQLDAFTFNVDISALTVGNGSYVFTAQAAGVTDIFGISGVSGRQVSWTQYISVPAIVAFQGLPNGTTDNGFTTIELLFNLPIDPASFTPEDIDITLGGVPQPGTLSIEQLSTTLFRVSGLENAITSDGVHLFTVDMTGVLSTQSEPGIQAQSTTLTLDNTGPVVAELTPLLTGGLDAQHRTGVRIRFSEPVVGLNTSAISFTRDSQPIILNIAQLSQIDEDEWQVTGFGLESYPDGDYEFTVSATGIVDAIGNNGTGALSTAWAVDRSAPITVTGVSIDPDLGISNSDGITSTTSFDVLFNLSANAAQVTIAQTSFGTEQVLLTLQDLDAGPHSFPVVFPTGGNTGLKVTAIGTNGGSSFGTKSLFIDQVPLSANWQTINAQVLTDDLTNATLDLSAAVLDPSAIHEALSFWKNGQPVSTGPLNVTSVNSMTYSIGNLTTVANGIGTYELRLDASVLNKATSGIAGSGSALLTWSVVPRYEATINARVFLEGPYISGMMNDSLRSLNDFPLIEPFTALGYVHVGGGGEAVDPQVLEVSGNDAIVDWLLLELRDVQDNSEVIASRSALLQRDGDVVSTDGFSPVSMQVGGGAYFVAVRHRNHLGAMTADTARFNSGITAVDFTLLSTAVHGAEAQKQLGARRALWAGDVNFDGAVQYVGGGNDRDPILVTIGGSTPTNTVSGYHSADVNMDGRVKYVGGGNDRDPILVNIGGSTPTNIREAQLPQP